ncbi:hypothetical protein [Leptospira santarosai]|uniref:hypothetical protein n=1 Tax=Leptospira santarosai TaxID=28183 RepID=UPI00095E11C0|nr:hypothetical protein [Leptospira santarosai]OLY65325.1 hypothetical protein BWD11_04395 [Leptospira santarosai serovar Grippotyphosa]ONF75747.1 hypothetical protein BWD12_20205 [Leptospira santarosai serovar Bananal]
MFAYIRNKRIRNQCESDYKELEICYSHACYKACLILTGGIIESILYDAVKKSDSLKSEVINFDKRNVAFDDLIKIARKNKMLSTDTFPLLDKIKDYRNAIHPNLYTRKEIKFREEIASIARLCLKEVINDIKESSNYRTKVDNSRLVLSILLEKLRRRPTNIEMKLYITILTKYGLERGRLMIERSIDGGNNL